MTNEEIITMARQAGFDPHDMSADFTCNLDNIEGFANLVAEAEREACAKVCEDQYEYYGHDHVFAKAIRARGQE